ncbi:MAG: hypothetical protein CM1200mP9_10080 [Gammaproteobacteria bacterium]|nr:MAG: hypothetical protein CM1200mP9_10080 [Gammaproteobacteria bacterium]
MESREPTPTESVDVLIVGRVRRTLHAQNKTAGLTAKIVEAGSGVGAPGFGIATPGHVAISKVSNIPTNSLKSFSRVGMDRTVLYPTRNP